MGLFLPGGSALGIQGLECSSARTGGLQEVGVLLPEWPRSHIASNPIQCKLVGLPHLQHPIRPLALIHLHHHVLPEARTNAHPTLHQISKV